MVKPKMDSITLLLAVFAAAVITTAATSTLI